MSRLGFRMTGLRVPTCTPICFWNSSSAAWYGGLAFIMFGLLSVASTVSDRYTELLPAAKTADGC